MFKQALPDLTSPICSLSCTVCYAEPLHHHTLAPNTSPYIAHHSGRRPSSTPKESYKEQENPQISFTKMSLSGSLHQEFECFGADNRDEWAGESTRSLPYPVKSCKPFPLLCAQGRDEDFPARSGTPGRHTCCSHRCLCAGRSPPAFPL